MNNNAESNHSTFISDNLPKMSAVGYKNRLKLKHIIKGSTIRSQNKSELSMFPVKGLCTISTDADFGRVDGQRAVLHNSPSGSLMGSPRTKKVIGGTLRNNRQFNSVIHSNNSFDSTFEGSSGMNFMLPNVNNDTMELHSSKVRKVPWGFDGYNPPITISTVLFQINGGKFAKAKNSSFIDDKVKEKEKLPPALKYNKLLNWTDLIKGNKGWFLKCPKKTITETFSTKKSSLPAPNKYETSPIKANLSTFKNAKHKELGIFGKVEKRSAFNDTALYDGEKSPGHIYNTDKTKIKPKIFSTTMIKSTKDRFHVRRGPSPWPGTYNPDAAFSKTQTKFSNVKFSKTDRKDFFDEIKMQAKKVPGVGNYKLDLAAYDKLSLSPRAHRPKRK